MYQTLFLVSDSLLTFKKYYLSDDWLCWPQLDSYLTWNPQKICEVVDGSAPLVSLLSDKYKINIMILISGDNG